MHRDSLARPLEDDWRETLDAVASARSWPTSRDVARLAARVADLSAAYNDPSRARAAVRDAGAARLGFSFPRDVPKGAAAVSELVATGVLDVDRPLRILDLGAGFGATTWGLARAIDAHRPPGWTGSVEATWVDGDTDALAVGAAIVRQRGGRSGRVELRVQARRGTVVQALRAGPPGKFDVVLLGQVLSELDVGIEEDVRLADHVDLVRSLLEEHLEEGGAVVIVEPALRDRTRHLHRVRDALAAMGTTIFAPCLHAAACPALVRETDWCHEDVGIDLPGWLEPVARAAGLRHEGLTFSYLVLRRGGPRLVDAVTASPGAARLRVVSDEIRTKGKREAFLCGELAGDGGLVAGRARVMRLDRDAQPENVAWERLSRGSVVVVDPAPELARPRVAARTTVSVGALNGLLRSVEGESR